MQSVASTTVSFEVGPDQLPILDAQMKKTVELGTVDILRVATTQQSRESTSTNSPKILAGGIGRPRA